MNSLESLKSNLIQQLFVRTADENYITARWCATNNLYVDFLWLAVHCLEKYLKAVMLSNGRSAKNQGHDIEKLFEEITSLAEALLPNKLTKPFALKSQSEWQEVSPKEFIYQISRIGNPDNRYMIYGYYSDAQYLFKLDQIVFAIRRLVCPLSELREVEISSDSPNITHEQWLTANPSLYNDLGMPLDELLKLDLGSVKRDAALNLNFPFAPVDYQHLYQQTGFGARNPVITWGLLDLIGSSDKKQSEIAIEAANWLMDNVKLPNEHTSTVLKEIKEAVMAASRLHNLPDGRS